MREYDIPSKAKDTLNETLLQKLKVMMMIALKN
jgi:hypothetical protein